MPKSPRTSLQATVELSTETDAEETRERCPTIHFLNGDRVIASYRSDELSPWLDVADGSIALIALDRTLGCVIDEEAWLSEMRRVLAPGGEIHFTVAASGPFAWLDARNIYRYAVDIVGRGDEPDDTLPTGWHRHYGRMDIEQMLCTAGLKSRSVRRVGTGLPEIPQLAGFIANNMIRSNRDTERNLRPLRLRMEKRDDTRVIPLLGSSFTVIAEPSV